ncbi:MAG TPA: class I SAM-dependent methyltransferase [Dehalococcoidia bacterium]|nr:class I SAM-dependent methyltransferase [Dehalococcoidia bacterium]
MAGQKDSEVWSSAEGYERYVGRWSRLVAAEFIDWLEAGDGGRWLDVGCGTGTLAATVLARSAPRSVAGIDRSEAYAAAARQLLTETRVDIRVADAQELPYAGGSFDAVVSGLVLNFVPDKERMAAEMARVSRPGGIVGLYVWDYAGEMQMMRRFWDAAEALDPEAVHYDEGARFTICHPERLAALFSATRIRDVQVRAIDVTTRFRDFDDYWTPFLMADAPAPGYCMSLAEDRRVALRERLRSTLPIAPDGSIELIARAWAVKGAAP